MSLHEFFRAPLQFSLDGCAAEPVRKAGDARQYFPSRRSEPQAFAALRPFALCAALLCTAISFALAGCGIGERIETLAPEGDIVQAVPVEGKVHGGVFPIVGATVTLMETYTTAGSTSPSAPLPASSYGTAAKALLSATSDANGNFNFGNWTCATNEFVYLVVTGGHTSNLSASSVNNSVIQVGVVGPCSSLATATAQNKVNVYLSEVSTVAAAAALGRFMSISPNDASGKQVVNIGAPLKNSTAANCPTNSTCASGLAHGFANAAMLVNSVSLSGANLTGEANYNNSNSSTESQIPAALLNTIGNIMQDCVDSVGGSSACTQLFSLSTGVKNGTVPQNTLGAALNMVQNPSYNVTSLYGLQQLNAPFTPNLASAPTSFAVSIFYGVTYNGSTGGSLQQYPVDVALDASDNAYILYANNSPGNATFGAIDEWTAAGVHTIIGSQAANNYKYPSQIAIDPSGNVFATNNDPVTTANDVLLQWVPTAGTGGNPGTATLRNPAAAYTYQGINGIAANSSGAVFVSSSNTSATTGLYSVVQTTVSGTGANLLVTVANATGYLGPINGLAVDAAQNVWGTGASSTGTVQSLIWPGSGAAYGTAATKTFTGASAPFSVAPGSGTTGFYPMNNELMSATYASSALTVNSSLASVSGAAVPNRSEVDGIGRVFWTDLETSGSVNIYAPTASPTMTSFVPCFAVPASSTSFNCISTSTATASTAGYTPAYFRGMTIDSAGNIWYLADAGYGAIIETFGVAAPTWPLLSLGKPGVEPQ